MVRGVVLLLAVFVFLCAAPAVLAHIPRLPGRGATLDTATPVERPSTSWVYYGTMQGENDVWYYRLQMQAGDRIYLQLITPERGDFAPGLALMGPGIESEGTLPASLEAPEGGGVLVRQGERSDEAEYEPFTPEPMRIRLRSTWLRPPTGTTSSQSSALKAREISVSQSATKSATPWVRGCACLPICCVSTHGTEGGS